MTTSCMRENGSSNGEHGEGRGGEPVRRPPKPETPPAAAPTTRQDQPIPSTNSALARTYIGSVQLNAVLRKLVFDASLASLASLTFPSLPSLVAPLRSSLRGSCGWRRRGLRWGLRGGRRRCWCRCPRWSAAASARGARWSSVHHQVSKHRPERLDFRVGRQNLRCTPPRVGRSLVRSFVHKSGRKKRRKKKKKKGPCIRERTAVHAHNAQRHAHQQAADTGQTEAEKRNESNLDVFFCFSALRRNAWLAWKARLDQQTNK